MGRCTGAPAVGPAPSERAHDRNSNPLFCIWISQLSSTEPLQRGGKQMKSSSRSSNWRTDVRAAQLEPPPADRSSTCRTRCAGTRILGIVAGPDRAGCLGRLPPVRSRGNRAAPRLLWSAPNRHRRDSQLALDATP